MEGLLSTGPTPSSLMIYIAYCESREGLWLQGETALQLDSFRDADLTACDRIIFAFSFTVPGCVGEKPVVHPCIGKNVVNPKTLG